MAEVLLVLFLGARDTQLLHVHHDNVVAGVHMGREFGFVLAAQPLRDFDREAAQHLVRGVDDEPVAPDLVALGRKGLHGISFPVATPGADPPDRYFGRFVLVTNPKL